MKQLPVLGAVALAYNEQRLFSQHALTWLGTGVSMSSPTKDIADGTRGATGQTHADAMTEIQDDIDPGAAGDITDIEATTVEDTGGQHAIAS